MSTQTGYLFQILLLMASSAILRRGAGSSTFLPLSRASVSQHYLFPQCISAGFNLAMRRSRTGGAATIPLRGGIYTLFPCRNCLSVGKSFSVSATVAKQRRNRSPLDRLAGSMDGGRLTALKIGNQPSAGTTPPAGQGMFVTVSEPVADRGANPAKTIVVGEATCSSRTNPNPERAKSWFREADDKAVGYWLLGSAGLVFGIVVLGGLTRLTESGLSITEWKPVTGTIPPLSQADWESEFAKYKDSPEYRLLNPTMTLEEFKFIYFMEWAHRLWGRVIGLSFVIPAVYFIARGRVSRYTAFKLVGISGFIGLQGFIGWWMVKSGLKDDLFATPGNSVPRVSQYRLTAHLCAAFIVYLSMLYNGLGILRTHRFISDPTLAKDELNILNNPHLRPFRRTVLGLALLVFFTAMSGGLVAGLDAGLIYNDFPKMGTGYKPPNSELFNAFYARDKENLSDLWWRNMLENPSTVQFQHRCLAMTTFTSIITFWLWARFGRVRINNLVEKSVNGRIWDLLNTRMRGSVTGVLHLALLQVTLGISTLIYMVPTPLAAAHQAGSLALLTGVMLLGIRVAPPPARAIGVVSNKMREVVSRVKANTPSSAPPFPFPPQAPALAPTVGSTPGIAGLGAKTKEKPIVRWPGLQKLSPATNSKKFDSGQL